MPDKKKSTAPRKDQRKKAKKPAAHSAKARASKTRSPRKPTPATTSEHDQFEG